MGGRTYYYEVESYWKDGRTHQRVVRYLGPSQKVATAKPVNVVSAVAYGGVNALHALCQRLDLVGIVNRHSPKGGGIPLGNFSKRWSSTGAWTR